MKRVLPISLALFLIAVLPVSAAESFTVSPAVLEMSLAHATRTITLSNTSKDIQTYSYSFEPFTLSPEGKVQFVNEDAEYHRLFSQIKVTPSTIKIQPGKSVPVQISLNAKNLARKDYYYAILIGPTPADAPPDSTVSQIAPKAAVPVLFSAVRDARRDIYIKSFDLPIFIFSQPLPVTISLMNNGNTFEHVYGSVTVKNLAGRTVESIELPSQYIFAGKDRMLQASEAKNIIINHRLLGLYRVTAFIYTNNNTFSQTHVIVAIPPLLITILGLIGFIGSGIYLRVKKYRS